MNKVTLVLIMAAVLSILTGCAGAVKEQPEVVRETDAVKTQKTRSEDIRTKLYESCKGIYDESLNDGTMGSLDMVQKFTDKLGDKGYAVVDQDNQFNMKNPDETEKFLSEVKEKKNAESMLIMVLNNGGFVHFDFKTKGGSVDVSATSYQWKEGELNTIYTDNYQAAAWVVSENGYLFFEKYYMAGMSGPYSHVAVRVKPLDDVYRQLNRKYIYPLGYYSNNLFITDWSETDYRNLNFYDLFERFYRREYLKDFQDPNENDGLVVLQIPKTEFERMLMKYVKVSSQVLQKKAIYMTGSQTYEYRPRGVFDSCPGLEIPFPEVIDCESRDDGTMVLTVNAVWPEMNTGTAFRHKVTIYPLTDGSFQYVSNQVIPSKENVKPSWYVERLTEDEWKKHKEEVQ